MWTTVAESLKVQAKNENMTVNHSEMVIDNHKCCENAWDCCRSGYWYTVFNLSFIIETIICVDVRLAMLI